MIEKNKLSTLLFLASEIAFFGALLLAYLYYAYYDAYANGPNSLNSLDPLLTGVFTVALVASSFTLWRAQKSSERDQQGSLRVWLIATIALGLIFILGQAWEYSQLIRENVTISNSLFGSTFFTLTGIHGLHVIGGLIMLLILLGLSFGGKLTSRRSIAIANVEYYWHFVDLVWLTIFVVVYLWPRL